MMKDTKRNESGAIMVEILAVLALIGVMGPVLFRQILTRNQEISNVNLASEMRTLKEAASALIAADGAMLGARCNPQTSFPEKCDIDITGNLESFLPAGIVDMGVINDYNVYLYGYQGDFGIVGQPDLRNMVYAVVYPKEDALPTSGWNFKRASRVASLIGADGGIADRETGKFIGTNGGWILDMRNIQIPLYETAVVTTAFDTFMPDIGMVAPNAVSAPVDLAFQRLHAWQYFSVGDDKGKSSPNRCFRYERTIPEGSDPIGDIIYNVGGTVEGGPCDPLFWVGTTGTVSDNSKAKQVYVKHNLYVGRENTGGMGFGGISAVALETHDPNKTYVKEDDKNLDRRIVVYDINGNPSITIDATGRILTNKTVANQSGAADGKTYQVDPSYTSVMNDIMLTSRGGARLSDILPNYIVKGLHSYISPNNSTTSNPYSFTIPKPTGANACPQGYAAAVIVTPVKWGGTNITNITVPGGNLTHTLTAPPAGGTVSGTITQEDKKMTDAVPEKQVIIDKNRENFSVEITPTSANPGNEIASGNAVASWSVRVGYKKTSNGSFDTSFRLSPQEISLLAQTYCVFDSTKFTNIPTKDRPTNP